MSKRRPQPSQATVYLFRIAPAPTKPAPPTPSAKAAPSTPNATSISSPPTACPERSRRIVPLDIWYIIPVEVCTPQPMLRFYPHRQAKQMRLEKYREAWHLLDPPLTIHACIDPDYPEEDYAEIDCLKEAYPEANNLKVP